MYLEEYEEAIRKNHEEMFAYMVKALKDSKSHNWYNELGEIDKKGKQLRNEFEKKKCEFISRQLI